jgi:hypothetical protein
VEVGRANCAAGRVLKALEWPCGKEERIEERPVWRMEICRFVATTTMPRPGSNDVNNERHSITAAIVARAIVAQLID